MAHQDVEGTVAQQGVGDTLTASDLETLNDGGLNRGLKDRHIQLIALGGIIGSCFFLGTGEVVGQVGPGAFLAYVLGGVIIFCVTISLGELAVALPISGSFVTYASEFISRSWAAGVGWTYWINWVAYIPAECVAAGIIMHNFVPAVSEWIWAVAFGLLITVINLLNVKFFGEMEFWLALTKIFGLVLFVALALLIWVGLIGNRGSDGFIGFRYITAGGKGLFPLGLFTLLNTMVLLLVNYQGSEIIGLTAGEAKEPAKTIPRAVRNVVVRICTLYIVPVFTLVLIMPWTEAGVSESVFAAALQRYGLGWAGTLFSIVALTAALSCANSGMYGTIRSLWSLSREGMAPKFLTKLNKHAVPGNATIATMVGIWAFLAGSYFFSASAVFVALLSVSGFTGTMCWLSLCWSQINFRRRLRTAGYSAQELQYRAPGYPWTPILGLVLMVAALVFVGFNPEQRVALYFGVPCLIIPMAIYAIMAKHGRVREPDVDRVRFDQVFPDKHLQPQLQPSPQPAVPASLQSVPETE